jgi:serine/threonine protein kinase
MTVDRPRVIGRYVLGHAIASGGMATVHLGRLLGPAGFSRTVAIKQLRSGLAADAESAAMFLEEARLASRIHHPNVVSPLDVVLLGDEAFIVMEYVHGESLSRLMKLKPEVPVPAAIAAAIAGQVLLGLHAAHRATSEDGEPLGLVHRDVSPQNILLTPEGVARLVDFGIAKATSRSPQTASGILKGKFAYMAPEQVSVAPVDCRTDLFAAGIVLWEMLTGRRLFFADTPAGCVQKIMQLTIVAPSQLVPEVPRALDEVVLKALAREAEERFEDAHAMALAVAAAIDAATPFEVGAWVTQACGASLAARAEGLSNFEAAPLDELTLGLPPTSFSPSSAPLPTSFPSPHGVEAAPDSVGGAAVSAAPKRQHRVLLLSLALTATAVAMVALHGERRNEEVDLAARVQARVQARAPSSSWAVEQPVASASYSAAVAPPPSEVVPEVVVPKAIPNGAAPFNTRPSPGKTRPGLAKAQPTPGAKPPSPCAVPYSIDARGVKRFNVECF